LEHAAGVANFDPEGTLLAYSAMPKSNSNNRHRHIADNDKCDAKMEEEFERKPILEQMLNYRKFYDGMDIYKFNAYGQMIHPIIQRECRHSLILAVMTIQKSHRNFETFKMPVVINFNKGFMK
jgi:hypothetical protein